MKLLRRRPAPRTVAEARENLFRAVNQGVCILLAGVALVAGGGWALGAPRVVLGVWVVVLAFGVVAEIAVGIAVDIWLTRKGGK